MLLDAPAYSPNLKKEAAIDLIKKAVQARGWAENSFQVSFHKFVFVPFYFFNFDIAVEGAPPVSGKAAVNAHTGEVNDLVSMLLDKPFPKVSEIEDKSEVEATIIKEPEIKETAQIKVMTQVGVKREAINITTISKVYLPFHRFWLSFQGRPLKVEIESAMGIPFGLEVIPPREKTWSEETGETVQKMSNPAGWFDLVGQSFSELLSFFSPKKPSGQGGAPAPKGPGISSLVVLLVLAVVIVAGFFAFGFVYAAKLDSCQVNGVKSVGTIHFVNDKCFFTNPAFEPSRVALVITVTDASNGIVQKNVRVVNLPASAYRVEFPVDFSFESTSTGFSVQYSTQ